MTQTRSILCAGRVYCDLVFTGAPALPSLGTEVFAEGLSLHVGGGAAITAATFAALGHSATLFATLPAAPFDTVVREDLAQLGVDTGPCGQGMAAQITVAIPAQDDRAFLTHRAGPALPAALPSGPWRHLHIGELTTAQEHPSLIAAARDMGLTVSLDCSWDAATLAKGRDLAEVLSQVDVFLPNTAEFEALTRAGLPDGMAPLTVVKDGANGARAHTATGWTKGPTTAVPVVDATGAGDAFNGGFLAAWLDGAPLAVCLAQGNRCGAAAVRAPGGTGGLAHLKRAATAAQ